MDHRKIYTLWRWFIINRPLNHKYVVKHIKHLNILSYHYNLWCNFKLGKLLWNYKLHTIACSKMTVKKQPHYKLWTYNNTKILQRASWRVLHLSKYNLEFNQICISMSQKQMFFLNELTQLRWLLNALQHIQFAKFNKLK